MLPSLDTTYPTLILKASRYSPLAMSRAFVWECWPGDPASFLREMATDAGVSRVSTFETDSAD
jgi:hypothetical protein